MMQAIDFWLVDAFSDRPFGGNAAAVCPLTDWLPDEVMLQMARQHNQSETAFLVRNDSGFELRWFTTHAEIDLCGHATLAAAHVIFEYLDWPETSIRFSTRFVGELQVTRNGEWLTLDLPARGCTPETPPQVLLQALGIDRARSVSKGKCWLVELSSREQVEALQPDFALMRQIDGLNKVCVTAADSEYDFVSRFFSPEVTMPEDPVTGSAHTMLIPWWGAKLGKTQMRARQVSQRGGDLRCEWLEDRVKIGGQARTYIMGKVFL
jgi:PhzF family phenazine biosynthesis protein